MSFSLVGWASLGTAIALSALAVACGNATDSSGASAGSGGLGGGGFAGHAPTASGGFSGSAGSAAGGSTAGSSGGGGAAPTGGGGGAGGVAGHAGSGGAACTPVAHETQTVGALSKDFAAVSSAAFGVYQVSSYFEQASSCAAMCPGKPAADYLLVRPEQAYVRACTCKSIADCQAQAAQAYCNATYQIDFTSAASDTILSGKSGFFEWPGPNNTCAGALFNVELIQLDTDTIRIDGSGVYAEVPPFHDPETGLDGCDQQQIETGTLGKDCNRVQVLDAKRVAALPPE